MIAAPPVRPDFDVAVIGGGAAGLSGALYLARAGRRVVVVDAGQPRNAPAQAAHGVFTRDGTPPGELLELARSQLARYPSATLRNGEAIDVARAADGFIVELAGGDAITARKLLIACGVRDEMPPIDGLLERWGADVHGCLYCHGHEHRDQALGVIARAEDARNSVAALLPLSRDILLCTDGTGSPPAEDRRRMEALGVRVVEHLIRKVRGRRGQPEVHFADGSAATLRALFVRTTLVMACPLPRMLGCRFEDQARIAVGDDFQTSVPGVYAAGDLASAVKFVVVAAASGAQAAVAINGTLAREDFGGTWHEPLCGASAASPPLVQRIAS
jgi:thioredoxin reductase